MPAEEFLLVDISNTFTKIARATREKCGQFWRIPTAKLGRLTLKRALGGFSPRSVVVASVVPSKNDEVADALGCPICWVGHGIELGVGIDYPNPSTIGADRLANAAGCAALYGVPAIVVDFGTAVTFDVISEAKEYVGGVIAPGLGVMTTYLHSRTALLPLISLREPGRAVGKSTRAAMVSGAVHGYRGLVAEIIRQIKLEQFADQKPRIVATGGDSTLIGKGVSLFDRINPHLTMEGLRVIGCLNFESKGTRSTTKKVRKKAVVLTSLILRKYLL